MVVQTRARYIGSALGEQQDSTALVLAYGDGWVRAQFDYATDKNFHIGLHTLPQEDFVVRHNCPELPPMPDKVGPIPSKQLGKLLYYGRALSPRYYSWENNDPQSTDELTIWVRRGNPCDEVYSRSSPSFIRGGRPEQIDREQEQREEERRLIDLELRELLYFDSDSGLAS